MKWIVVKLVVWPALAVAVVIFYNYSVEFQPLILAIGVIIGICPVRPTLSA